MHNAPVRIESHPPERRSRQTTTLYGCCCTCCCCCCLHTLGGIIGATVAPAIGKNDRLPLTYYYDEELDIEVPNIAKPGPAAVKFFWWTTTILAALTGVVLTIVWWPYAIIAAIVVVLVFPFVQLASAVVTLVVMTLSTRPDKAFQVSQARKIGLGVFVGGAIGGVLTVGVFYAIVRGFR